MEPSTAAGPSTDELLTARFNQEHSCLAVGTRRGYQIFACEPFTSCHASTDGAGIAVLEMLHSSSLVALVSAGERPGDSPRRLRLWNTRSNASICDLNFSTAVLAVRMNKARLLAVLEAKLHIFELATMKLMHTLETTLNPRGLGELCAEAVARAERRQRHAVARGHAKRVLAARERRAEEERLTAGRDEELDIDDTIRSTAHNGGMLDIKMRPERKNTVKVLLMLDIGGSMDAHVKICEELFSATRTEFKHLESFYFHNFIYESVWKDNRRRMAERLPTFDIFNKYAHDYKVVFVGDATMAPYEITHAGGSVEHWNEEPGATWMERFDSVYDKLIWLNPTPQETWEYSSSVMMTQELVGGRMYPLTVRGLEESMGELSK